MMLDRFLSILYYKEYDQLIIEGSVPESVLKEAWAKIYLEYCDLTNDSAYNELFDKTKRIQEMNARISLLDNIVQCLQLKYNARMVAIVNEMGIGLELTAEDDPISKLKIVQGRMKRMILDMENLKKEVEQLQQEKRGSVGIEQFEDWLGVMSRSYGYAVLAKDISVIQFVRNQKRLTEQYKKQQRDGSRVN